jgi:hypothetical protein
LLRVLFTSTRTRGIDASGGSRHREKHAGQTVIENLALSCTVCNRRKGSDLSSLDPVTGTLVPLFNPRTQLWSTHFRLEGAHILGMTIEGRTTAAFLRLNAAERLMERTAFPRAGRYPPGSGHHE